MTVGAKTDEAALDGIALFVEGDDLLWSRVVWSACRNGDELVAPARAGDLSAFTLRGEKPARAGLERLSELIGEELPLTAGSLEGFRVGRREAESTE